MFKVIKGIFEGYEFAGKEIEINGQKRIWDCSTKGRSYPKENCIKLK